MVRRFVLLITMLVLLAPTQSISAQTQTGTITLRSYFCPNGYAEQFYLNVCTQRQVWASLTQDGNIVATVTDYSDAAVFVVPPGTYNVSADVPGDFVDKTTEVCQSTSGPNEDPDSLEAGETIECQEFIWPSSNRASNPADELDLNLTIRLRICDDPIPRTEFHTDCFDQPEAGVPVAITSTEFATDVVTGADGNVTVAVPDFTLAIDPDGTHSDYNIWRFCSAAYYPGIPMLYPLELTYLNSDVTCDIYLTPRTYDIPPNLADGASGEIDIHYRQCPVGYQAAAYFKDCHDTPIVDAAVELRTNREATYTGYTDAQGDLFFRVSPGRYDLPPDLLGAPNDHIAVFCTEASSPNTQIEYPITIAKGEHITCDLYLLPA